MVQLKLSKTNIIDLATIAVVVLVVATIGVYYLRQPVAETTKLNVTVEITDPAQVPAIAVPAINDKSVYFDSINIPVTVAKADKSGEVLEVTLNGSGHIGGNGYFVFNGQRILIGQKAEIHASYFAQGKIVKIENAN